MSFLTRILLGLVGTHMHLNPKIGGKMDSGGKTYLRLSRCAPVVAEFPEASSKSRERTLKGPHARQVNYMQKE
jgi:hypothetical protein